jgi:DNA processing protein
MSGRPAMSGRRRRSHALPPWWSPSLPARQVLLGLAATPGPLPAVTAARLAAGEDPASLLCADSPAPGEVAARLDALGLRLLLPADPGWPFAGAEPDPPCAWLFVAGPDPPAARVSVAVVGGRKASTLRRATARALATGLARAGLCVVSGGAVGVDAAAHAGALDAGGRTVVVLGCGLDVPYPGGNVALFRRVRAAGGTLLGEHPPGTRPLAANFVPRNRLIAALSSAVVVVEAASGSGSLSTARAAGSRGDGRVLAVPGAPWDPGASGCNDLIRDGATLVGGLDDVLEALGTAAAGAAGRSLDNPRQAGPADVSPGPSHPAGPPHPTGAVQPPDGPVPPGRAWPAGATPAARTVFHALIDGQVLGLARLAAATGLPTPAVASALLELELAGFVRRSAAGAEALTVPCPPLSGL